jgi:hypothetical protein
MQRRLHFGGKNEKRNHFLDVDIEELVEMLLRDLSQWSEFSDAGVGEYDIDSPLPEVLVLYLERPHAILSG